MQHIPGEESSYSSTLGLPQSLFMPPPPPPGLPGEQGGSVHDSLRLLAGLAQGLEDGHSGPHTWGGVFLLQTPLSPLRSATAPLPPVSLGSKEGQLMTAYECGPS